MPLTQTSDTRVSGGTKKEERREFAEFGSEYYARETPAGNRTNDTDNSGLRVRAVITQDWHSCTLITAATLMPEWESRP